MYRHLFILITCMLGVGLVPVAAQSGRATPAPTPAILPDVPVIAANYRSNDRTLPDMARAGVDPTEQKTLTLREAIELALENNLDIEVTRKTRRMAEFDLKAYRGFYQPRLINQSYNDRATAPNISIFSTNRNTTVDTQLSTTSVNGYIPSQGTILTGSFNHTRLLSDNPISVLSPQLNASMSFSFTQPILRGRKFDIPRRAIEIAKRNIDLTDTQFRQRSIETVAAVQRAYWDLTFALRNLQVQRDAVRDAREQLEHNRRLVDEGQLAPIDVTAAETQVANFEQLVYDALNTVNQSENALKNLISPNRNTDIWLASLTPVEPVEVAAPITTLPEAVDLAITNRPELEINNRQRDINKLDQKLYREQKKPQIDFTAGITSSGIGGDPNRYFDPSIPTPCTRQPPDPTLCQRQLENLALLTGSPFSGIFSNRYPTYHFGINFNIPLFGDKTASANLGHALVEGERLEVQRQQLEQSIQVEVRNAIQGIRTAEARLRSAAIARENSEKQYESEQRKLDNGQSDTYKVLDRQTALTAARSNELRARTDLNKAIAELQRATGSTLKANDVEVR